MFGSIGPTELILIFVLALLVFGPKKLPEIGKSVGKALREFKKASDEIKGRIEEEIQASEIKDVHRDIQSGMNSLRDGIRDIGNVTGVTDLKKELASATDLNAPPSSPPASQVPAAQVPDPYAQPYASTDAGNVESSVPLPTETAPSGIAETAVPVGSAIYPPVEAVETPAQSPYDQPGPRTGETLSSSAKKPSPKSRTAPRSSGRKAAPVPSSLAKKTAQGKPRPLAKSSGRTKPPKLRKSSGSGRSN